MMSQNRNAMKDRVVAGNDYEVNLKAELEILALHQKVDELRKEQSLELLAMQRDQIQLLTRLLAERAPPWPAAAPPQEGDRPDAKGDTPEV